MTTTTVKHVDADQADDTLPPSGTAIVRPLRHVQAVRDRHLSLFASPAEVAGSRATRAWAWVLGEIPTAPITDRYTRVPASRADIEGEIAAADERRLSGDQENRVDAAAIILRWLIVDDDHVPVRCENPGELVGGFGDIVRSPQQMADLMAAASSSQRQATALSRDPFASPDQRRCADQDADYLSGVAATLSWALGEASAPITRVQSKPTTRNTKTERLHAEDLIGHAASPWLADRAPSSWYGEGVKSTITWLIGDATVSPLNPVKL